MNFERKFVVDPAGNAEERELTQEEKEVVLEAAKQKKKVFRLKEERKFSVDPKGETKIEKDK